MNRREFITLPGGAAAAWPITARAQQAGRAYRDRPAGSEIRPPKLWSIFVDGLREFGWIEGNNIVFDRRYAENKARSAFRSAHHFCDAS